MLINGIILLRGDIVQDLKEIQLTNKELEEIYKVKKTVSYMSTEFITDLYKYRYKLKIAPSEICKLVGKSKRTIQYHLKAFGWQYDIFEAQKMAAKKRDYADIFRQNKAHQLNNAFSSKPEEYCRQKLSELLTQNVKGEIIVGVNNRSILDGAEIDIPIVIIKNNKIYKYAIEFNSEFWHNKYSKDADNTKVDKINSTKYKYFEIWQLANTRTQREYGTIDEQVNKIVETITAEFKGVKQ
jgi:hypothetical protein